jgi:hypothetical protein
MNRNQGKGKGHKIELERGALRRGDGGGQGERKPSPQIIAKYLDVCDFGGTMDL